DRYRVRRLRGLSVPVGRGRAHALHPLVREPPPRYAAALSVPDRGGLGGPGRFLRRGLFDAGFAHACASTRSSVLRTSLASCPAEKGFWISFQEESAVAAVGIRSSV